MKAYYVYILTNKYNTALYVGVTNNIIRRVYEHENKLVKGFTERYNLDKLIYYEVTDSIESAILREKQIRNYCRAEREILIENFNKDKTDLYDSLL